MPTCFLYQYTPFIDRRELLPLISAYYTFASLPPIQSTFSFNQAGSKQSFTTFTIPHYTFVLLLPVQSALLINQKEAKQLSTTFNILLNKAYCSPSQIFPFWQRISYALLLLMPHIILKFCIFLFLTFGMFIYWLGPVLVVMLKIKIRNYFCKNIDIGFSSKWFRSPISISSAMPACSLVFGSTSSNLPLATD